VLRVFRQMTGVDRLPIALAIVLAVLLRALVPAGYMPDVAALADGRLALTICHGDELPKGDPTGGNPRPDQCPFAAISHAPLGASSERPCLAPAPAYFAFTVHWGPVALTIPAHRPPLPFSARAPPPALA